MSESSPKLALLIWAATPDRPDLLPTPLIHALAARALDVEVEIHFAGPAVRWLVEGVAAQAYPTPAKEKSLLSFMEEASAEGCRLLACSMALAAWARPDEKLIPLCHGHAGATAFVAHTLDRDWKTLVF